MVEDEDVNSTFREAVDFSAPNVKVQTAKIQSPQASKRERSIFSERGTCNEICSYRNEISVSASVWSCSRRDVRRLTSYHSAAQQRIVYVMKGMSKSSGNARTA